MVKVAALQRKMDEALKQRAERILKMRQAGLTLALIAQAEGVSKERIHQILKRAVSKELDAQP